jgi:hypothetical protein
VNWLHNDQRERREPAATDAGNLSDLNGWLPSAARSYSLGEIFESESIEPNHLTNVMRVNRQMHGYRLTK